MYNRTAICTVRLVETSLVSPCAFGKRVESRSTGKSSLHRDGLMDHRPSQNFMVLGDGVEIVNVL